MKRIVLFVVFLLSVSVAKASCPHSNGAAAICTNCYNQAVAGYTVEYVPVSVPAPVSANRNNAAYQSVEAYGDAEKVTTTTVTERVTQSAPPANQAGLIVKEEYVQPQTTILVPKIRALGSVNTYGTGYGNTGFGFFGQTQNYHNNGNFGNFQGNNHYNSNGNFQGNSHDRNNFRGFQGNGHGGNFNANFRSGHGNGNGGNGRQPSRAQQTNGNGKVQPLPRVNNAINALRGR